MSNLENCRKKFNLEISKKIQFAKFEYKKKIPKIKKKIEKLDFRYFTVQNFEIYGGRNSQVKKRLKYGKTALGARISLKHFRP